MPLVDDRGFHGDRWRHIADDETLPETGDVIVSQGRIAEALARPCGRVGTELGPDGDPEALAPHFSDLALIAVTFRSFADGRGFSLARQLRALGFTGELRAAGHVICDQYAFLRACGFDHAEISTDLAKRQPEAYWLQAAKSITVGYQRGLARGSSIFDGRHPSERRLTA